MKRTLWLILRILVSGGLLFLILRRMNFGEAITLLKNANIGLFLAAFVAYFLLAIMSTLRWYELLRAQRVKLSYNKTLAYYLVGFFFNNFLPAVIGGGAIRAFYAGRVTSKNKEAFASMATELIFGLIGLFLFTIIVVLVYFGFKFKGTILAFIVGGLILMVVVTILLFNRRFIRKFRGLVDRITFWGFGQKLKEFYNAMYFYKDKRWLIFRIILYSFGVQFAIGLMNFFIGESLGFQLPFMSYIVYTSIISILMMAPITINGLGVREWGYRFFFAFVGLNSLQAITLSLLFYFVGVIGSLSGGLIFPFMKIERGRAPKV